MLDPRDELSRFMAVCRYEAGVIDATLTWFMGKGVRARLEAQRDRLLLLGEGRFDDAYEHRPDRDWAWLPRDRLTVAAAAELLREATANGDAP